MILEVDEITAVIYLDVPGKKLGSMVIGSMGYFTDPDKSGILGL